MWNWNDDTPSQWTLWAIPEWLFVPVPLGFRISNEDLNAIIEDIVDSLGKYNSIDSLFTSFSRYMEWFQKFDDQLDSLPAWELFLGEIRSSGIRSYTLYELFADTYFKALINTTAQKFRALIQRDWFIVNQETIELLSSIDTCIRYYSSYPNMKSIDKRREIFYTGMLDIDNFLPARDLAISVQIGTIFKQQKLLAWNPHWREGIPRVSRRMLRALRILFTKEQCKSILEWSSQQVQDIWSF